MSKAKKMFLSVFSVSLIFTVLFAALTVITDNSICFALAITFGTMFYHFAMRLFVGSVIGHKFNYKSFWFKEKNFEKPLYKTIKVKKWKDKMPSYNPQTYMTRDVALERVINTMCRNEVIHEVIALLSFVPILFSIVFGTFWVFFITSVIACLIDLIFVIMQRYNRPKAVRILERQNRRNKG